MRNGFVTLKLSFLILTGALTYQAANGDMKVEQLKYQLRHHTKVVQYVVDAGNRWDYIARKLTQLNSRI